MLERSRPGDLQSGDWIGRQTRKIEAGTAELARLLGAGEWFTASGFGLADIAAGCALGYLDLRFPEFDWRSRHPALAALLCAAGCAAFVRRDAARGAAGRDWALKPADRRFPEGYERALAGRASGTKMAAGAARSIRTPRPLRDEESI